MPAKKKPAKKAPAKKAAAKKPAAKKAAKKPAKRSPGKTAKKTIRLGLLDNGFGVGRTDWIERDIAAPFALSGDLRHQFHVGVAADPEIANLWEIIHEHLESPDADLTAALARERVEQFRVLFLDPRNRLLADEAQESGRVKLVTVFATRNGARTLPAALAAHAAENGEEVARLLAQQGAFALESLSASSLAAGPGFLSSLAPRGW